ncbi:hypothetical protein CC80DRAFT_494916 [Byssothecium circinans]|uniref:Uncharacterized protein n=1 Tax=Byssothecium circinans TaxID=147558 RepID=A0A6A5TVQ7_9PLEO|nr:hypothetical protein CC80DRAFT_494916 [Byssothecium circinans]
MFRLADLLSSADASFSLLLLWTSYASMRLSVYGKIASVNAGDLHGARLGMLWKSLMPPHLHVHHQAQPAALTTCRKLDG